jgi:hypothetical protein
VSPVPLDAKAINRRIIGADPEVALLALGNLDRHGQGAVPGKRIGLEYRDARKNAKRAQPFAGLLERLGGIGLPLLEA